MSIKLYGMTYSNYYNMVKTIMIEKDMDFEEVHVLPNQESDFLVQSPMGKVPCLETDQGFITETGVMIDYLDNLGQGPSFYPDDAFAKAKVQELIRYLELYIELPARRLYGEIFFGKPSNETLRAEVKPLLEKGFAALGRLAAFDPYLAGEDISYADFYCLFALTPAIAVCKKAYGWDVFNEVPNIAALMKLLGERDSVKKVRADQAANT